MSIESSRTAVIRKDSLAVYRAAHRSGRSSAAIPYMVAVGAMAPDIARRSLLMDERTERHEWE